MKITKEWLEKNNACEAGKQWFYSQKASRLETIIAKLGEQKQFAWANWTITKMMTQQQNVKYACFSAYECLANYEKVYPADKRPRQAIEAALMWIKNPTEKNKLAVRSAESAAWSAARSAAESAARSAESAARSARSAELAARSAAWSAALSARSAVRSAESAESAALSAESAARSAELAARSAAESAVWKSILLLGLKLLTNKVIAHVIFQ